jgi:hypothetical protein
MGAFVNAPRGIELLELLVGFWCILGRNEICGSSDTEIEFHRISGEADKEDYPCSSYHGEYSSGHDQ